MRVLIVLALLSLAIAPWVFIAALVASVVVGWPWPLVAAYAALEFLAAAEFLDERL